MCLSLNAVPAMPGGPKALLDRELGVARAINNSLAHL